MSAELFDLLLDYENGELDEAATVALFQKLVDTGIAWQLQGHYGRTAMALAEAGRIVLPPLVHRWDGEPT